jgi:hypothetical protein
MIAGHRRGSLANRRGVVNPNSDARITRSREPRKYRAATAKASKYPGSTIPGPLNPSARKQGLS